MFNKLKNIAGKTMENGMAEKAIDKLCPELKTQLEKLKNFDAREISCDETFTQKFTKPAQIALAASTYGVTKMIPGFEDRFSSAMLHCRNELCVIDQEQGKVSLATEAMNRLPQVLQEGFKKTA